MSKYHYNQTVKISHEFAEEIEDYIGYCHEYDIEDFDIEIRDYDEYEESSSDEITNEMTPITVDFDNGIKMQIRCVQKERSRWADAILLKDNTEIKRSNYGESYLGQWTLEYDGDFYTVNVKIGKETTLDINELKKCPICGKETISTHLSCGTYMCTVAPVKQDTIGTHYSRILCDTCLSCGAISNIRAEEPNKLI